MSRSIKNMTVSTSTSEDDSEATGSESEGGTVVTISCQEEECDTCDADIDALPVFLNEFGRSHDKCLVCDGQISGKENGVDLGTIKAHKEICIKSILPDVQVQSSVLDKSYPFCKDCTDSKVARLTDLYRQLLVLQETFDDVRFLIVQGIIKNFVKERPTGDEESVGEKDNHRDKTEKKTDKKRHGDRDGDKLFQYWKRYATYPKKMDEEENFPDIQIGKVQSYYRGNVMFVPLPIPTSPETSDGEVRIKTEPVETSDQETFNELLNGNAVEPPSSPIMPSVGVRDALLSQHEANSPPQSPMIGFSTPGSTSPSSESDDNLGLSTPKSKPAGKQVSSVNHSFLLPDASAHSLTSGRNKKRSLTRKVLLDSKTRLEILRQRNKTKKYGNNTSTDSDSSSGSFFNRALKAKRKAIRTLGSLGIDHVSKVKKKRKKTGKKTRRRRIGFTTAHHHNHNIAPTCDTTGEGPKTATTAASDQLSSMPILMKIKEELASFSSSSSSGGESPTSNNYPEHPPTLSIIRRKSTRTVKRKVRNDYVTITKPATRQGGRKTRKSDNQAAHPTARKSTSKLPPRIRNGKLGMGNRTPPKKKNNVGKKEQRQHMCSSSSGEEVEEEDDMLNLFKCTPNITEGNQRDVKIPDFNRSGSKNIRTRKKGPHSKNVNKFDDDDQPNIYTDEDGTDYYEVPPPNYFIDDEENSYSNSRSPSPRKKQRRSFQYTQEAEAEEEEDDEEEYESEVEEKNPPDGDEDSSDDYEIGIDVENIAALCGKKRKRIKSEPPPPQQKSKRSSNKTKPTTTTITTTNAKTKNNDNQQNGKGLGRGRPRKVLTPEEEEKHKKDALEKRPRGRPRKNQTPSSVPTNTTQQEKVKKSPKTINPSPGTTKQKIKKERVSVKSEPRLPPSPPMIPGDDVVDLTTPTNVSAFSTLLTQTVRSLVQNVDPSPSPTRRYGSRNLGGALPPYSAQLKTSPKDEGALFSDYDDGDDFAPAVSDAESYGSAERKSRSRTRKPRVKKPKADKSADSTAAASSTSKSPGGSAGRQKHPKMCSVCGKILVSSWNLTVHMRTHTDNRPYPCTEAGCTLRFFKPENLRTHLRHHTKERPYRCELCNARFSYRVVLRTHKAAKHKVYDCEGVFECVCGEKTIAETFLRKHFRSCERKRKREQGDDAPNIRDKFKVYCNYCEIQFEDGEEFKTHQTTDRKHIDIKNAKLAIARKELGEYEKSKETPDANNSTEVECQVCGEKQPDNRLLQIHMNKLHTQKGPFNCDTCGKLFSSFSNLKTHQVIHDQDKPFVCPTCNEGFNTKVSLTNHTIKKHGTGSLSFSCTYCTIGFSGSRAYHKHMVISHKELHCVDKPHICTVCYFIFREEGQLDRHLRERHADLICLSCGKMFGYRRDLRKHMEAMHRSSDPLPPRNDGKAEDDDEEYGSDDNEQQQPNSTPVTVIVQQPINPTAATHSTLPKVLIPPSLPKPRGRPRKTSKSSNKLFSEEAGPSSTTANAPRSSFQPPQHCTSSLPPNSDPPFNMVMNMPVGPGPLPLVSSNFDQQYAAILSSQRHHNQRDGSRDDFTNSSSGSFLYE